MVAAAVVAAAVVAAAVVAAAVVAAAVVAAAVVADAVVADAVVADAVVPMQALVSCPQVQGPHVAQLPKTQQVEAEEQLISQDRPEQACRTDI